MAGERSIIRRGLDVITGKTRYTPNEADRFIGFMDQAVARAVATNPELADNPELVTLYGVVKEAAVGLQQDAVRGRRVTRRNLLIGGGVLLVGGLAALDGLGSPYVKPELVKPMSSEERMQYERDHLLANGDSVLSVSGWKISYEKHDPRQKFVDFSDYNWKGQWVRNYTTDNWISFYTSSFATSDDSTGMWFSEFESATGKKVPVIEVKTVRGNQVKILSEGAVDGLDTGAVRFSRLNDTPFTAYLGVNRVETSQGTLYEAVLKKRVPV